MPTVRALLAAALLFVAGRADAKGLTGEQVYRQMCASCHGLAGQGTKRYPQPLAGERSVEQLADLIDRTMPEDDPDKCDAEDSRAVAAYIHGAFYSRAARDRDAPPRVELARLTVAQFRYAVADLVAEFRGEPGRDERRGLHGVYFNSRGHRQDKKVIDRIDPEVRFDFGTASPEPGKIEDHTFSIRWQGSLAPPATGTYEFVVRSDHAVRLWVNDNNKPVIDATVKSGSDNEYRAGLFLLAGRPYTLRLEFSKAKQGVDDSKQNKPKPRPASVELLWKPPHGPVEVVPSRCLSPVAVPEAFAVSAPFPPDDRSLGWERGTTVSKAWDQAATEAALETADYVAARLDDLAGTRQSAADRPAKLREFARRFVERAFRRPLSADQKRLYVERQFEATPDPDAAVKRVVLLALKSPRFLYREAGAGGDGFDVAGRLAFALWDAPPDKKLLAEAAAGRLATRDQVARQAERLLDDPRAAAKLREFLLTWLKVDHAPDLSKDPKRFPGFTPEIVADLRASLELALADASRAGPADFRKLLLDEEIYLNGRLSQFYGAGLPAGAPFQKVRLDAGKRAGVLTHPYLMAGFAYAGSTSPIHRGVFLARGLLGLALRPPPEAFAPLAEDLHPTLTTRERVALQTRAQACVSCHGVINPLGFALEGFDAVGRVRDADNNKPIDAAGYYKTRDGREVKFGGARELAAFLADSPEAHAAFAEQLFHHLVKQPVRAYGPGAMDDLRRAFADGGLSVRKLAATAAVLAALPPADKAVQARR